MRLILYSKPGCHLCEGLQEKLEQIVETQNFASLQLEIRDITIREDWFAKYEYEVPVIYLSNHRGAEGAEEEIIEVPLPRPSPRASVQQLEQMLRKYLAN
ncbi:glutaredoxin family protein [Nostoc sp. KVJ3]|uniref:glutaredoxin family protein n=1 Tax=Nostoc sp. KVJ3 TaxID=457945 RepID=UPI002238F9F9|nr:glutaredoxin family protein [Nostoc sp. KVJ3]MCW5313186.1 glutaredoxin family protein [Nostoc sp. KVJ3]